MQFPSPSHTCLYPSPSLLFLDSKNFNIQPCRSGSWPRSLIYITLKFRCMWSDQILIWLETLFIWTDSEKDLSSSDLPSGIYNYSAGRSSFPPVTPQTLKNPPETTSDDRWFSYESKWLKTPLNSAKWAIKISTWTPPTSSTLTTTGKDMPLHLTGSKQCCIKLEPMQGWISDDVL